MRAQAKSDYLVPPDKDCLPIFTEAQYDISPFFSVFKFQALFTF